MVGVGACVFDLLYRCLEAHAPGRQQTDQFGDDHGRVGVIDLHHHVLAQFFDGIAFVVHLLQNQLGGVGDHEVLLVDTQTAPGFVSVIRVQEQRQVLFDFFLVEVDAVGDDGIIHGIQVEEIQGVDFLVVAGHVNGVHGAGDGEVFEGHFEVHIRAVFPGLVADPGVGIFHLSVVFKLLAEQTQVVVQADAVARKIQRGDGIQEAGCQTAETAVAQRGLGFDFLDFRQCVAGLFDKRFGIVVDAQVDEVVGEQLSDEEFRGNVVQLFVAGDLRCVSQGFFGEGQKRRIHFFFCECCGSFMEKRFGFCCHLLFSVHITSIMCKRFHLS